MDNVTYCERHATFERNALLKEQHENYGNCMDELHQCKHTTAIDRGVARRRLGSTGFNISSQLNLNEYPFKKKQLPSRLGSTLERKEFAPVEQILSFKSRPYLRKASLSRKAKRK